MVAVICTPHRVFHRHFWNSSLNRILLWFLHGSNYQTPIWNLLLSLCSVFRKPPCTERKGLPCEATQGRRGIEVEMRLVSSVWEPPCCPGPGTLSGFGSSPGAEWGESSSRQRALWAAQRGWEGSRRPRKSQEQRKGHSRWNHSQAPGKECRDRHVT